MADPEPLLLTKDIGGGGARGRFEGVERIQRPLNTVLSFFSFCFVVLFVTKLEGGWQD